VNKMEEKILFGWENGNIKERKIEEFENMEKLELIE